MEKARRIFGPSGTIADNVAWPYGMSALNARHTQQRYLVHWADDHGLRVEHEGCFCLNWLRRERSLDCHSHEELPPCGESLRIDHAVAFTRNGKPAVVTNAPYELDDGSLMELGKLAAMDDLTVSVGESWYGRGTVGVFVWNTDVWDEYLADGRK